MVEPRVFVVFMALFFCGGLWCGAILVDLYWRDRRERERMSRADLDRLAGHRELFHQ